MRLHSALLLASTVIAAACGTTAPTSSSRSVAASESIRESSSRGVPFARFIDEASATYGLDPALVAAVIRKESAFDPRAVSRRGAEGLMQLMPRTARYLGVTDAFDPRQNILGGTRYLHEMLVEFGGDVDLALAAYNAGPTAVKKAGLVPPTAESREYVASIRREYRGDGRRVTTLASRR